MLNLNKKNLSVCFIGSDHERYSDKGNKIRKNIRYLYTSS